MTGAGRRSGGAAVPAHQEHDDIAAFRAASRAHAARLPRALPELPLGTYDRVALDPGAPVAELMVYRPAGGPASPGLFLNLHGGGFVLGDWQDDDPFCRYLADAAGCVVVNLDYVLAPEHPFPAAVRQVDAVLTWLSAHAADVGADAGRVAVGGHSAGGNLAVAACLLRASRGDRMPDGLLVDYAPLDLAAAPATKLAGRDPDAGTAAFAEVGARFNAWYLADSADGTDPLASPVLADDLGLLPPTLVLTAEQDLLRAEAELFVARARAGGADVEHTDYPGCGHGFTHVGPDAHARAAWQQMAGFLRRTLTEEDSCA